MQQRSGEKNRKMEMEIESIRNEKASLEVQFHNFQHQAMQQQEEAGKRFEAANRQIILLEKDVESLKQVTKDKSAEKKWAINNIKLEYNTQINIF